MPLVSKRPASSCWPVGKLKIAKTDQAVNKRPANCPESAPLPKRIKLEVPVPRSQALKKAKQIMGISTGTGRGAEPMPQPPPQKPEAPKPEEEPEAGVDDGEEASGDEQPSGPANQLILSDKHAFGESFGKEDTKAAAGELACADRKDRDREYASFKRAMESKRNPAEAELVKAWEKAVKEKSHGQKTAIFTEFFACGGDQKKMVLRIQFKASHTKDKIDKRAWLTRDDLLEKYGKRSDKVDALIARKKQFGFVLEHPDFPGDTDMQLYWCLTELSMSTIDSSGFSGVADAMAITDRVPADLGGSLDDMAIPGLQRSINSPAPPPALEDSKAPGSGSAALENSQKEGDKDKASMKGGGQKDKGKKDKKAEPQLVTPHDKAKAWAKKVINDIGEAKTLCLQIGALRHTSGHIDSMNQKSVELESFYGQLIKLINNPQTSEKQFLDVIKKAMQPLEEFQMDISQARNLLALRAADKRKGKKGLP